MSTFAFLALCIQACLIFNVCSTQGAVIGSLGIPALGYGAGLGPYGWDYAGPCGCAAEFAAPCGLGRYGYGADFAGPYGFGGLAPFGGYLY